ncbi:chitin deacetylase [Mortierella antarctica]|nr:chitin deacetylase [Mortierella antarctica]KAG0358481.1 chitin deacetylase [Podila minutissima]
MVKLIPTLLALSASLATVFAHRGGYHQLEKRQNATAVSGCPTTYAPIAAGAWPFLDCTPFVQDPQVVEWLKLVDMTKVPVYPQSKDGVCPTDLTTIPAAQCWWTCQKCDAPDDITSCPKTGQWGLTYDDGPSPDSPRLYDVLAQHKTQATLFIVGSRAVSYPATLKAAYAAGHQIAIHTWSHPAMTSLTNQQIVAELKWTEKAIQSVIGVTPIYWRPPCDVDARVRAIATQLGYKTSIWTQDFDTNDWNIPAGTATPQSVIDTFKSWLVKIPTMSTGFIVLEHDLFPAEVNVSLTGILPLAYADKALTMMPIARCIGDAKPYKEGAGTFSLGNITVPTTSGSGKPTGTSSNNPTSSSSKGASGALSLHAPGAEAMWTAGSVLVMTLYAGVF